MAQYAHLSNVDGELAAAIAALPPPPPVFDIMTLRKLFADMTPVLEKARESNAPAVSDYRVEDRTVSVEGGVIRIRILTPTPQGTEGKTYPLLYWMHCGGWSLGDIEMDDHYLRSICVKLGVVITNVDYRLAPEYIFPTALNDCYTALKWTVENAPEFSADLSKGFLVGGASAGGSLSAVLSIMARDDPFFQQEGRRLTGQFLEVPVIVHPDAIPEKYKTELLSMEQNKDAPLLTRDTMLGFYKLYDPTPESPLCSPLLARSHKGLPPAYFQISGLDPLRDEGLLYEKVLKEAGVKTKVDVYPGYPHVGNMLFPTLAITKKYDNDVAEGLRWLLGRTD